MRGLQTRQTNSKTETAKTRGEEKKVPLSRSGQNEQV